MKEGTSKSQSLLICLLNHFSFNAVLIFFLTVGAVMLKWKKDEKFLNVKQFSLLLCEEKKHFYFKLSKR